MGQGALDGVAIVAAASKVSVARSRKLAREAVQVEALRRALDFTDSSPVRGFPITFETYFIVRTWASPIPQFSV
jgi:hypothetical protein